MKKISLKGLKEVLSEKELKGVMAGSGSTDPCQNANPCGGSCTNINGQSGKCLTMITGQCRCTINTF